MLLLTAAFGIPLSLLHAVRAVMRQVLSETPVPIHLINQILDYFPFQQDDFQLFDDIVIYLKTRFTDLNLIDISWDAHQSMHLRRAFLIWSAFHFTCEATECLSFSNMLVSEHIILRLHRCCEFFAFPWQLPAWHIAIEHSA